MIVRSVRFQERELTVVVGRQSAEEGFSEIFIPGKLLDKQKHSLHNSYKKTNQIS